MLYDKYFFKVIFLVTFHLISTVVSREVYSYGWPSMSNHEETVSKSDIDKVLTDALEREKLRLSVDQIFSERPQEVPTCANTYEIYDPVAKICSPSHTQGHCEDNMIFLPVPNTRDIGTCACRSSGCYGRPQVLFDNNQCYDIASQGPCDHGETIVPIGKFQTECGPDTCLDQKPEYAINFSEGSKQQPGTYPVFQFAYKGSCYATESQAFCKRGQVVRFVVPYKIPICVDRREVRCAGTSAVTYALEDPAFLDCNPNTPASFITKKCRQRSAVDFD